MPTVTFHLQGNGQYIFMTRERFEGIGKSAKIFLEISPVISSPLSNLVKCWSSLLALSFNQGRLPSIENVHGRLYM